MHSPFSFPDQELKLISLTLQLQHNAPDCTGMQACMYTKKHQMAWELRFLKHFEIGFIPQAIRRTQLVGHKKENPEAKLCFPGFPLKKGGRGEKKHMFIQMFKIVVILVETVFLM